MTSFNTCIVKVLNKLLEFLDIGYKQLYYEAIIMRYDILNNYNVEKLFREWNHEYKTKITQQYEPVFFVGNYKILLKKIAHVIPLQLKNNIWDTITQLQLITKNN